MDAIILVIVVIAIGIINIIFCMINIYYNNKYLEKTEEYIDTLLTLRALEQTRKEIIKLKENNHGNKN